jgi:hypothetical protein
MLSKCANPDCCEQFRYLHEGKLFYLSTIPEQQRCCDESGEQPYERFWLCDHCAQQFTVVWDGVQARVVSLPPGTVRQAREVHDKKKEPIEAGKTAAGK